MKGRIGGFINLRGIISILLISTCCLFYQSFLLFISVSLMHELLVSEVNKGRLPFLNLHNNLIFSRLRDKLPPLSKLNLSCFINLDS